MRTVIIQSVFLIIVLLCVSSAGAVDLNDGFLGLTWGSDISEQDKLTRLYDKKDVTYYTHPDEVYTISEIAVPNVVYGFHKGKFFAVYIGIDAVEGFDEIKKYLKTNYGMPDTSTSLKSGQTVYKWKYRNVKTKMKINKNEDRMKLAFYYMPISNLVNEEQLETFHEKSSRILPIKKDKKPQMLPLLEF